MSNFKIQVPIGLSLIIHIICLLVLVFSLTSTIHENLLSCRPIPNLEEQLAASNQSAVFNSTVTNTTANTTANQSPPPSTPHTGKPVIIQQCMTTVLTCIGGYMFVWLTSIVVESVIYGYSMSAAVAAADDTELMNCRKFRLMLINKFGILLLEMLALFVVTIAVGNGVGFSELAANDDDNPLSECRQWPMTAKLVQLTVAWWSMLGTVAIMIMLYKLYTNYMGTLVEYYRNYLAK
ncbi:uncharacterized protein LOC128955472 [Oppia nitens]|uniref:uncharacterized protein LOC128955472 n=1 Tax=Oppia nitens TaxID=1686743 RepID=UPI0023DA8C34|nr:uncharacterized protein LOC128955472 [Oppia nitens]